MRGRLAIDPWGRTLAAMVDAMALVAPDELFIDSAFGRRALHLILELLAAFLGCSTTWSR